MCRVAFSFIAQFSAATFSFLLAEDEPTRRRGSSRTALPPELEILSRSAFQPDRHFLDDESTPIEFQGRHDSVKQKEDRQPPDRESRVTANTAIVLGLVSMVGGGCESRASL